MTALLRLESFDADRPEFDATPITSQDVDAVRGQAFEDGYGAGWADALEQMRNEDALRRSAAEEALQAITFSYREACAALEDQFIDLAAQMIEKVLPDLTRPALSSRLEEDLRLLATRQFSDRVVLMCAPGLRDTLSDCCERVRGLQVLVQEEPSFSETQVMLRIDQNSRLIDFDAVLAALRSSLAAPAEQKDVNHG